MYCFASPKSKPIALNRAQGHRQVAVVAKHLKWKLRASAQKVELSTHLGSSGVEISQIGIGAFSWGESFFWEYGKQYGERDVQEACKAIVDGGINYIDTAELYGFGESERLLGECIKNYEVDPIVSSKFAPYPWRASSTSVVEALKSSLTRLQRDSVGLYMIHWPGFLWNAFFNDAYIEGLGRCVREGLAQAAGVSNFKKDRVLAAHKILGDLGVPLSSNQIQYNLLYRKPEQNGLIEVCKELGVTVCAYCPLAQGLLTGKYSMDNLPEGGRKNTISKQLLAEAQPLLKTMKEIGENHGGKSQSQVAINWTICKGTVPIVGARNALQVREAVGATGWKLSEDEIQVLEEMSSSLPSCTGAPYEDW